MPIIISKNRKDAWRVERTSFKEEKELQKYIFENPNCVTMSGTVTFIVSRMRKDGPKILPLGQ